MSCRNMPFSNIEKKLQKSSDLAEEISAHVLINRGTCTDNT